LIVDINGDSLDLSHLQNNNATAYNNIINDLQQKTGLTFFKDKNGNIKYKGTKRKFGMPKPKITNKKNTSRKARRAIMKAIHNEEVVEVKDNSGGGNYVPYLGANEINIDDIEINQIMGGNSADVDNTTMGYGLVFLHELGHTGVGGSRDDPDNTYENRYKTGKNVRAINKMRRQLGNRFGKRSNYFIMPVGAHGYLPMNKSAKRQLKKGNVPATNVIQVY